MSIIRYSYQKDHIPHPSIVAIVKEIDMTFMHNGEEYFQVTPSKRLFNSTMVHETVIRGDIFAVRVRDNMLTILPRTSLISKEATQLKLAYDNERELRRIEQIKISKIVACEKAIQDMRVQLTLQMKTLKDLKGEI